jgi:hypothetical protein
MMVTSMFLSCIIELVGLLLFSINLLVGYHISCILIGYTTSRLLVIRVISVVRFAFIISGLCD